MNGFSVNLTRRRGDILAEVMIGGNFGHHDERIKKQGGQRQMAICAHHLSARNARVEKISIRDSVDDCLDGVSLYLDNNLKIDKVLKLDN